VKKPPRIALNLCLVFFSILVTVLLCEVILRFTPLHSYALPVLGSYPKNYYKADPVKGYDIQENFPKTKAYIHVQAEYDLWSNELGCFDRPYLGEKHPVLLVGDSFTHAYAPFEDKWGTRVEQILGVRVLKCGVSGYGIKQSLLKAKDIVQKTQTTPSLIILGYFLNDLRDDLLFPFYGLKDGYLVSRQDIKRIESGEIIELNTQPDASSPPNSREIPAHSRWQDWWGGKSIVFKLVDLVLENLPYPKAVEDFLKDRRLLPENSNAIALYDYSWIEAAWVPHLKNLREFKKYADSLGSKLVVVIIPAKEQVLQVKPGFSSSKNPDFDRPNRILHQFLGKEGIAFLDLLPFFKEYAENPSKTGGSQVGQFYWKLDGHWNREGNHLAGQLVAKYLLENKLAKSPDLIRGNSSIDRQAKVSAP